MKCVRSWRYSDYRFAYISSDGAVITELQLASAPLFLARMMRKSLNSLISDPTPIGEKMRD